MKVWLIAAILATVTGSLSCSPYQGASGNQQPVKQQPTPNPAAVTVVVQNSESSAPAESTKPKTPEGDAAPQWALVVVGIITFLIIGWQSIETGRAACAAEKSARAAEKNIQLLINEKQSLIMVDIEAANFRESDSETAIDLKFFCVNHGNAVAQITEKGYVFRIAQPPLSQEPDFSKMDTFHHASEYLAVGEPAKPYPLLPKSAGLRRGTNMLMLYGLVKYRDVYGEHETRFGFQVTGMGKLERLPADSYPKYNEHK